MPKQYLHLIEIDISTGLPTGNTKPNSPLDPDYIPPVVDLLTCPLPTTTTTTTSTTTTTTTVPPTQKEFRVQNYSSYSNIESHLLVESTNVEITSLVTNSMVTDFTNYNMGLGTKRLWISKPVIEGDISVTVSVFEDGISVFTQNYELVNDIFINGVSDDKDIRIDISTYTPTTTTTTTI